MTSPFDAAVAAAAPIHDAVMGELFDYSPMARSADRNAPAVADPDRAFVAGLLAVWGDPSARAASGPVFMLGVKPGHPGHESSRPFISLQLARLPYAPREGDRVTRQKTGALMQVAEILPSVPGFARLDLNRI